jgi:osmoprotectant transport system ATP-binding protein
MDEPFGALDPVTRAELTRVFQRIQRDLQQTVLLVTHDLREAAALGSRVGILEDGSLIACDTPEAISQMDDPRVQRFLGASRSPTM